MSSRGLTAGRLVAFAGLTALVIGHWAALLVDPPLLRLAAVMAVALALAEALRGLGGAPLARRRRLALATLATGSALLAGLVIVGIPLGQLLPWGWDELAVNVDDGFSGLAGELSYPLETDNGWSRLLMLAPVPLFVIGAAALAYWPVRPQRSPAAAGIVPQAGQADQAGPGGALGGSPPGFAPGTRLPALTMLIAGYAFAVAVSSERREYWWGILLLALISLWFWAPRIARRGAIALLAAAAVVSVPIASAIRSDRPWVDYTGWQIPASTTATTFSWDHSYGPIDWPRTGDTLFRVRSAQPRYWRAELLETFDGRGWRHVGTGGPAIADSIPTPAELAEPSTPGIERADVSVVALESSLVVSPGTPLGAPALSGAERQPDGSMLSLDEPLGRDTSYSVTAYVPDPEADELRAASRSYPPELSAYTQVTLPLRPRHALTPDSIPTNLPVPTYGSGAGRGSIERAIDASAYRQVGVVAERLAAGEPTAYDVTKAIEAHLRDNYDYDEEPPERRFPLASFIGGDRAGYCQQFSGSMALMLRMLGIPSRVATGFTPGERRPEDRELFEVTDLDAHSWVEVYFNGIGWVPFDPTPSTSPASSQSGGVGVVSAAIGAGSTPLLEPEISTGDLGPLTGGAGTGEGGGPGAALWVLLIAVGLPAAALGLLTALRALHARTLDEGQLLERQLSELPAALRSIGWPRPEPMTLLSLERRLESNRKSRAASYVAGLRDLRYSASGSLPSAAARRAARRELAGGRGIRSRLRMLLAMPPGAPRRH